ncbi:brain and acute leukemia cytoplasmic protein [Excalfactoria chinensis]|uniref:brain and acute leukemia cytoplasmic protein n=1 Tax=Excalfactoria chinensis TaxID=46218 RepID=UPI003B3A5320
MGCGGSRADAIEPRYYESWTRETESTWLTNTDSESPQEPGGAEPGSRELGAGRAGILEDGKSTQTGGSATPATTGILNNEKRTISGAQCVNTAGTGPPRQSSFRAAESKRDSQKMSTKEVTISVSKTIRPSDRRTTKNCVN